MSEACARPCVSVRDCDRRRFWRGLTCFYSPPHPSPLPHPPARYLRYQSSLAPRPPTLRLGQTHLPRLVGPATSDDRRNRCCRYTPGGAAEITPESYGRRRPDRARRAVPFAGPVGWAAALCGLGGPRSTPRTDRPPPSAAARAAPAHRLAQQQPGRRRPARLASNRAGHAGAAAGSARPRTRRCAGRAARRAAGPGRPLRGREGAPAWATPPSPPRLRRVSLRGAPHGATPSARGCQPWRLCTRLRGVGGCWRPVGRRGETAARAGAARHAGVACTERAPRVSGARLCACGGAMQNWFHFLAGGGGCWPLVPYQTRCCSPRGADLERSF
jgi:hypothetical protein